MHTQFCETYYVETSPDICDRCRHDPPFHMQLVENRIKTWTKFMEENGGALDVNCQHKGQVTTEKRMCCGGEEKDINIVYCNLHNKTVEESYCQYCFNLGKRPFKPTPKYKIIVYGFPSLYGGAGTELHHQILAWNQMPVEIHIIPTNSNYQRESLHCEMLSLGVKIHKENDFSVIDSGDPVIGFCNAEFLDNLDEIYNRSQNTVFVNCMTWLFEKEKQRHREGKIRNYLYQNPVVRAKHGNILKSINNDKSIRYLDIKPYFESHLFPFVEDRPQNIFGCGRISRQDADKFHRNTLHIYEYFVSPVAKSAIFLGFDQRSQDKIGKPFGWIRTCRDQTECSQQDFYKHCEIILQPSDTTENWPRIGFEAMASGSVLIVDKRGGWRRMIEHGKTGFLCETTQEFIYWASRMAFEPNYRREVALAAKERGEKLSGLQASIDSWTEIFEALKK